MKITLIMIGKTSFSFVKEGYSTYEKRIKRYINYESIEIPDLKKAGSLSPDQVKEKEGELILKRISPGDILILLDQNGKRFSSIQWASEIQKSMVDGKNLFFIIGGAYGFSEDVYSRAERKLSLSDMTFSHQIIRLFFAEQLYRAMTIIKGDPYHNE